MASSQGMCKNCGSLIMFDDRDSNCECVFCHCVFPSAEAIEILSNPEGRTFANEKFEASSENSHHYTTRVYSTESLEKQIQREELKRAQAGENTAKTNEYEVTAKDVKAPKNLVIGIVAGITAFVVIVLAISIPTYMSRRKITDSLEKNFGQVYSGHVEGHTFYGQTCQTLNLITNDQISEETAVAIYENFCEQRAAAGKDDKDNVTVFIYCQDGKYTVDQSGASLHEDENPGETVKEK